MLKQGVVAVLSGRPHGRRVAILNYAKVFTNRSNIMFRIGQFPVGRPDCGRTSFLKVVSPAACFQNSSEALILAIVVSYSTNAEGGVLEERCWRCRLALSET